MSEEEKRERFERERRESEERYRKAEAERRRREEANKGHDPNDDDPRKWEERHRKE